MALDLATIVVSGNLLSNDFLLASKQLGNRLSAFDPGTFDPSWKTQADFDRAVAQTWDDLKERFDGFDHSRSELLKMDTSALRNQWLLPVLRALGFAPTFQKAHTRLKNVTETYPISHRGWNGPGAPALHLLGVQDDLDLKPAERGAKSPQMMLQSYLNQDTSQRWAVLTNGFVLRLLRDYFHTSQPGYVQFNLFEMFLTREFDEFRSLYRLAHASRFRHRGKLVEASGAAENDGDADDEDVAEAAEPIVQERELPIWLEVIYEHARSEGSRAEAHLRDNVRGALELLGHGLLTPALRNQLSDPDTLETYYRQLLRVVYRSIFLLFAEQRGLIPDAAPQAALYRDEYSLTALRNMSEEQRFVRDTGADLWERLLLTFELARVGNSVLGVQPFNGNLFERDNIYLVTGACHDLAERNRRDDLPNLSNDDTLRFIECLGYTDAGGVKERINYRDLKVEEIGHIYESLLDYTPRIAERDYEQDGRFIPAGTFFLDAGTERKSTGSYYTPKELVQEVIVRALEPVLIERFEAAGADYGAKEQAILSIKVLDPACGSAAFLIAATDTLAQELANLRWQAKGGAQGQTDPNVIKETFADEVQRAKRDVLAHCIYGVDLNDMAVELAQVALWINAASAGYPLSFLDHRVKHGNSLVGAPLNFVQLGIDPDAYKGRGDADPDKLKTVRKGFTKKQLDGHRARMQGKLFDLSVELPDLDSVEEHAAQDVRRKAELYEGFRTRDAYKKWELVADYWTSAFFYPVREGVGTIPSQQGLNYLMQSLESQTFEQLTGHRLTYQETGIITQLKHQYRFFHYWLEFPEVFFEPGGDAKDGGGFDVIVGNPPWERVKLQEKEFFSTRDAEIANAANASKRKKLIAALETENPDLYEAFENALTEADATSNFLRVSGRYPLGGVGDVNTYQVFTENARDLTGKAGRTGIIVPSGIATDNTTKDLFRDFVENQSLVSLDDFENRELIFKAVGAPVRFCLLILTAPGSGPEEAQFSFFNSNMGHLKDPARWFTLSFEDFTRINPNTLTCPTFRTGRDAEITLKMYERAGVFIDENDEENGNPWGASFMRMFDMSNDSSLFRTKEELEARGLTLQGSRFVGVGETYLPLYEPKFIQIYDHRFNSYENVDASKRFAMKAPTHSVTEEQKQNFSYTIEPRFWVRQAEIMSARQGNRLGFIFRGITNSTTNNRTLMIAPLADYGSGNGSPLVTPTESSAANFCLLANLASIPLDFSARNKVGGANLNFFIFQQFPAFKPSIYSPADKKFVVSRMLELTYTAWDIKPFADDVWQEADEDLRELFHAQWQANAESSDGGHPFTPPDWAENTHEGCPLPPFTWNEERRAELRAELDALYAHLYGLTREELEWILDPRDVDPTTPSLTFPGLRRNEEKRFGEYRTKRLVLKYFDRLAAHPVVPDQAAEAVSAERA